MISIASSGPSRRTTLAALAFLLLPAVLAAQEGVVSGAVRDSGGVAIVGAEVTLVELGLQSFTDAEGGFRLPGVRPGPATLRVRRLGYRPVTAPVAVTAGGSVEIPVVLERIPQNLQPVVVEAGRREYRGRMAEFYMRRDRGMGTFFTYEDIARRNPMRLSDLFRTVPGLRVSQNRMGENVVTMRGNRCTPLIWLDGTPASTGYLNPDYFEPLSFEGIEIYTGPASVPPQLMGVRGLGSCGVIALWTKLPEPRGKRGKTISPEELAALLTSLQVYTADQVDVVAMPDSAEPVSPMYPDSLLRNGIEGNVLAEFVVDTTGLVESNTVGVVTSSHPLFTDAVRAALRRAEYRPAVLNGRAVRQLVQQPFRFVLPPTARPRRELE
jgi:TonB family protein